MAICFNGDNAWFSIILHNSIKFENYILYFVCYLNNYNTSALKNLLHFILEEDFYGVLYQRKLLHRRNYHI